MTRQLTFSYVFHEHSIEKEEVEKDTRNKGKGVCF